MTVRQRIREAFEDVIRRIEDNDDTVNDTVDSLMEIVRDCIPQEKEGN